MTFGEFMVALVIIAGCTVVVEVWKGFFRFWKKFKTERARF